MAKMVLTAGLTYAGPPIAGVQIDNLGLCRPEIDQDRSAFPLYEYDTVIINPASYSHFLFGQKGEFSDEEFELSKLKQQNDRYDFDSAFDQADRENEMKAAIEAGANVVWCLAASRRQNFFGYRDVYSGYCSREVTQLLKRSELHIKKGRRIKTIDLDSPFSRYFQSLQATGWTMCLADELEGFSSVAITPEGYSIGGKIDFPHTRGWLLTPPTSQDSTNQLIRDAISVEPSGPAAERFHGVFLSHTAVDKPFVRKLRDDLQARGVDQVWVDEAEIDIGDSLISKIEHGMSVCRYFGVVLSPQSINAPWVKKELETAMTKEIAGNQVVVLPLLYQKTELPPFLQGKMYADFTEEANYEASLSKLLRRLRIKG